ncbi:hypothetical protein J31TS4_06170 [Paenibacillus sp. J31TS4]|uniref:class I SAM-dependent methyltransferase n=1 Tax=Paenibacillus sp. J31TS4 TaxID=2807195 RepID=UPI001B018E4A|nr:class I SAM-dependent methyltransferase [Paenibacillus sp. J31TS4]GIP37337.1 hypothetical protein J31TS4_06170 [Paenibacillus sp. J31TS4]
MLVTTSYDPPGSLVAEARRIAAEAGVRFVPRERQSLRRLMQRYGDKRVLLLNQEGLRYHEEDAPPLFFHPSMAQVRIKRMLKGENDHLIEVAGVRPGDTVLDGTAGFASDSLVFAVAVGEGGTVTALESEEVPALLLKEGLRSYVSGIPELDRAMRRMTVRRADHAAYLAAMPDDSVDVVYLDPMFRRPVHDSSAMTPLRALANPDPIHSDTIANAVRAARRTVVLKEHRNSEEFDRLGFTRVIPSGNNLAYGVIDV